MGAYQVIAVDDHQIVLSGIKMMCELMLPDVVLDEANNTELFVEKLKQKIYDLVILDINLPNTDTHNLIVHIRNIYPQTSILIFSMGAEEIYLKRYMNLGIQGFVSKDSPKDELIKAIKTVQAGGRYISAKGSEILSVRSRSKEEKQTIIQILSDREFEIFQHLVKGASIKEICQITNLHTSTIATHKHRIFTKLKARNVIELKEIADQLDAMTKD